MRITYINQQQAVAALRLAAYGIEEADSADGITVADLTRRIDDALRVVLGRATFDALDDGPDEYDMIGDVSEMGEDPETPKF